MSARVTTTSLRGPSPGSSSSSRAELRGQAGDKTGRSDIYEVVNPGTAQERLVLWTGEYRPVQDA